ncbi:DNA methyltransferase [uncultured Capnocytophaga sp.]|jgi:pspGI methylase|uniref:DNA methyltransferase n=1 Tax=uncultured Capnocytophaga sp. TaxID=159273 RepID=UPI002609C59F|nr:DNA methyltransferase [uncultured Capnocytophaga sp.]
MTILETLDKIAIDYSWSFSDKTIKDTSYITHGYYTYPAKFIPQLAGRLIEEYSKQGDIVIDPFMGSGTTVVEALVNDRIGIGTDVNEIAYLISKVKTTPIESKNLYKAFFKIENDLHLRLGKEYEQWVAEAHSQMPKNERIDYWFLPEQRDKLAIILFAIKEIGDKDIQDFFLVAFSQILKSTSIWLQKSIKPTRDLKKKSYDPLKLFLQQSQKMIKKHIEFDKLLSNSIKENIDTYRKINCGDSRMIPCADETAQLVVTSPPYVTSYEYADLHQLPSLWLGFLEELAPFRKKFIGSSYKEREEVDLQSSLANSIVKQLKNKKEREVRNYFADMLETFTEVKRVLKKGGKACFVIGNTEFKGVKILNAEVFKEQFESLGFQPHSIIKREIPSKMLPSTRDVATGRFGKATKEDIKLAYPTEYILIMEKI